MSKLEDMLLRWYLAHRSGDRIVVSIGEAVGMILQGLGNVAAGRQCGKSR